MSTKTNRKKCLIVTILILSGLLGTTSVSLGAGDTWTEKAPMPTGRLGVTSSVVNGKIYAIGGYARANAQGMRTVEEYDPATDTWTTKAPMPTGRRWLSSSAVNGKIYVFGGYTNYGQPGLSTVEEYDPATDTWTAKTPMPTARLGLATAVVDGIIYVIGGAPRAFQSLRTVEAYDPLTDTWTTKADMPTARFFLSTSVVNGKIYGFGGTTTGGPFSISTVEEYDPATDTWTTKASMPTARQGLGTSVVHGEIYAIGGGTDTTVSTVEAYDPLKDTWTQRAEMPTAKLGLAATVVNGRIYAIGGAEMGSPPHPGVRTVYEYDTTPPLVVDFNGDEIVDSADISMMVDHWHTDEPFYDIAPTPFGDGIVDVQDLVLLSEHLFEEILPPGMIGCWKLDEIEGDIAYDSVENQDGFLIGDPVWQPTEGKRGGALKFDGINDHIMTNFIINPADGPFSVFAWIKGGAPGQAIICQEDGTGNGETWLGMGALGGNLMTGLVPPPIGRFITQPMDSESVITDDQWHHIGFVWDGLYRILYVDGTEVAKDTSSLNPLKDSNGGLYIGTNKNLDAGTFFSGLIDDVRIYDMALTAEEIAALAR